MNKHFCFFSMNNFLLTDGGTVRMRGIIEALVCKGHDVTLISNAKHKDEFPQSVRHIFIDKDLGKNKRRIIQLMLGVLPFVLVGTLLRKFCDHFAKIFTENLLSKHEIIFFEYFDNSLAYLFKKRGLTASCVNDVHGIAPLEFRYKTPPTITGRFVKHVKYFVSKSLDRKVYGSVDGIVVLNPLVKEYLIAEYPFLKGKKTYIVPDGVSKSLLGQEIDYGLMLSIRDKFNITDKTKVILFAGAFKNSGGVPDLVTAFIEVNKKHHNLKLLLVGDGEEYAYVKKMVGNNGISDKVVMLGRTNYNKLKSYQMLSDVIVCPDKKHPLSDMIVHIKYFEALSSGKVIINGDFRSLREINRNEQLSLSFEPSDIHDLTAKLTYALDNLETLSAKYKKNAELIGELYGYSSHVNGLL